MQSVLQGGHFLSEASGWQLSSLTSCVVHGGKLLFSHCIEIHLLWPGAGFSHFLQNTTALSEDEQFSVWSGDQRDLAAPF